MLKPDPFAVAGLDPETCFSGVREHKVIGLAVSGGPDSLALMLLVKSWCERIGADAPKVFVYSVDHGLRPEAATEAAEVVRMAESFGFTGRALRWVGDKPQTGIQAAARTARYQLIGEAMAADGATVLLTAHHLDDQAETLVMRMAHGSGVSGLGGMRDWAEVEGVHVHRPLLGVARKHLHAVVAQSGLTAFTDPSNLNSKYERVRWRQALPALADIGLDAAGLSRLARRMQRADAALTNEANAVTDAHVTRDQFGVAYVPASALRLVDEEIALRVLGHMIASVSPDPPGLEQLEDLLPQVLSEGFSGVSLAGSLIEQQRGEVLVYREAGRMRAGPASLVPGETLVWDGRFELTNQSDQVLEIQPGFALTRKGAESFVESAIEVPMAAVRALPLVLDPEGKWVALGVLSKMPQLSVGFVAANRVGTA